MYINQATNNTAVAVLYVIATCGSLFFSKVKAMIVFGVANLTILLVVMEVKRYAFTSLWCGYAAVASLIILAYFWRSSGERPFLYAHLCKGPGERIGEMTRARQIFLVVLTMIAVFSNTWGRGQGIDYAKIEILTEKLAPNFYLLSGSAGADPGHEDAAGGRIGVLAGPDGILMVDAQYAQISDRVLAAIRKISPEPIRFLVNTHVHGDHTAGNANFVKMGALLFAREELREEMLRPPAAGNSGAASDPARLPVVTYGMGDPVKLRLNGEIVDLIPVRAAHTGGDTMIRFENADAIMIGDFYRNFGYPFIDTNNGGTLKGALEALDATMKLSGPNTRLIPGHGTIINRTDMVPYRDMILGVQARVQQMIDRGKSEQEVLAAKVTAPYDAKVPGGLLPAGSVTSADRFVSMVYSQLKGGK